MCRRLFLSLGLSMACAMWLTGCNLFSSMHADGGRETNVHVLVADGKAALARGDAKHAFDYFRAAYEIDPRDSEVLVGCAEAFLRQPERGFSLGKILQTLLKRIREQDSSGAVELLNPPDWGAADMNELSNIFTVMVILLDPIAEGRTHGPYRKTDVSINLNVALFYLLRFAANVQAYYSLYNTIMVDRDVRRTDLLNAGIPASTIDALSQNFLWFEDASHQILSPSSLLFLQQDISLGMTRLQTAANNSSSQDSIQDVINLFNDWQTLINPTP